MLVFHTQNLWGYYSMIMSTCLKLDPLMLHARWHKIRNSHLKYPQRPNIHSIYYSAHDVMLHISVPLHVSAFTTHFSMFQLLRLTSLCFSFQDSHLYVLVSTINISHTTCKHFHFITAIACHNPLLYVVLVYATLHQCFNYLCKTKIHILTIV